MDFSYKGICPQIYKLLRLGCVFLVLQNVNNLTVALNSVILTRKLFAVPKVSCTFVLDFVHDYGKKC